ncbi:diacylglycerol/lipid kinase family protein [Fodinicurvata sediminis]|uniref:diacylglycerol/lipid kinase family protein n=1 Tax=Fodinicurvata sediminis TaxID=1121832 RepID=UPI0003B3CBBB|nr:diacylglycerol kinase family protein [Fodinicurvata sediminis]
MRLAVIYNPAAGLRQRRVYLNVLEQLRSQDCDILEMPTRHAGHGEAIARRLTPATCDRVVAAGGDGTVNEVANGLLANRVGGQDLPLAILPLGTANVLAREIGLPRRLQSIVRFIREGQPRPVSVGRVNDRHFLLMAGVGFDAHVVTGVRWPLKRRIGKLAYVVETLRQLLVYDYPEYRLQVDGQALRACSVIVANARHYGGRYRAAPAARLEADSLEVCLFTRKGRLHAAKYAAALVLGFLHRLPDVHYRKANCVLVEGPLQDPVQGDGDWIGTLPCEITLCPSALTLVFPR